MGSVPVPTPPVNRAGGSGASASAKVVQHPSVPVPPPPDLIESILPAGSLNLLSGGSGVGKTAFIADWCARFRDGRSICWHPTRIPTGIGIIVGDRAWSSHKQWFDAVGFPDIAYYSLIDDPSFNWERLNNRSILPQLFEEAIVKLRLGPGALIIIDPISLFMDGNLIGFRQTAIGMAQLKKVIMRQNVTVIGIVHTAKQKADKKDRYVRPQDRILGSGAQAAFSDTTMFLVGPEEIDAEYHGFGWIPHHAAQATFSFLRNPDTGLFIPYEHPNKEEDIAAIYSYISESPNGTRAKEIVDACADHLSIAKSTLYTYMNILASRGMIEKVNGSRGYWRRVQPPLQAPPPPPAGDPT